MGIVKDMFLAEALGGGGGGGSDYTLLGSKEFEVSTTSTSATDVGTITVPEAWTDAAMIYIKVRDKAGMRSNYFVSYDSWWINYRIPAQSTNGLTTHASFILGKNYTPTSGDTGVYPSTISKDGTITIKSKYNSSLGTIDGTYVVEVYALPWPKNDSPFKEATA